MRPFLASFSQSYRWAFCASLLLVLGTVSLPAAAQDKPQITPATRPLITDTIDETRLTTLKGNTHPLARREFDLGAAPASMPLERMLLVLKRSDEQETALRKMLDDQQDKKSPNYHQWLTPEKFGAQYGASDADLQTITAWLQSHGFQVGTTKGRTVLEFSGSARQVQEAFHTSIHKYMVKGEQHWANDRDPQIPTALTPAVSGVFTLHNFLKKPTLHWTGEPVAATVSRRGTKSNVTFPAQNGQAAINALGPQDYAVIYNINPLYNGGIQGGSSVIGVVGRSNLFNSGEDILEFMSLYGLCCSGNFQIVLNGPDPGDLGGGEEAEATLDSSWAKAIAPIAGVDLVVSASTDTTDGVDLSEVFIIENNLADVMTESFSSCELFASDAQLAGTSFLAEQAAAQGITYLVSTGDDGAEACDDPNNPPATNPISVNELASTAFTVAVGGTMFNEHGNASLYWGSTAPISETALSYIPENVWNESSPTNGLWSGSGGASAGNLQNGGSTPGVPKPSWQSGVTGIPNDLVRDLPDVSLTAAIHDPYLLCLEGSCQPDSQGNLFVYFIGGTSASTPAFAGIMALVDEQMLNATGTARQGQANYVMYRLAATQSEYPSQCNGSNTAGAPASTCIFNDVTSGNNVVPGEVGSSYQAGSGYDLTTGLGSVNVNNLVSDWNTVTFNPTTTTLTLNGGQAVSITHGQSVPLQVAVAPNSGTGVPSGEAVLLTSNGLAPSTFEQFPLSGGQAISSTSQLPGSVGTYSVWAQYSGDGTYAPSKSNLVNVSVSAEPSITTVSVETTDQNFNIIPFTSGPFGSFVYLRADVAGQSGQGIPVGSVTFTDTFGAIPGGNTFNLNGEGNTATPNGVFTFDSGTHTISASYSGDGSFNPGTSTQSQTFTITPGFFAGIPSAQSTVTIAAPGGAGASSLSVSSSTGFSGTIALACTGLPSETTCSFSPASVVANGTATTTSVNITVITTAPTAASLHSRRPFFSAVWFAGAGLLLSTVLLGGRRQGTRLMLLAIMLLMMVVLPGCGGSSGGGGHTSNPGTPAGSYNVTVTASSGSIVSASSLTLVVQ